MENSNKFKEEMQKLHDETIEVFEKLGILIEKQERTKPKAKQNWNKNKFYQE